MPGQISIAGFSRFIFRILRCRISRANDRFVVVTFASRSLRSTLPEDCRGCVSRRVKRPRHAHLGWIDCRLCLRYALNVTASEIIEEIKRLDPKEQLGVIRFAYQLDAERQLSGQELSKLAARMTETDDDVEAATIREGIVRGFYGAEKS